MSNPIPPGWQWTKTITGHKQLEHVASGFAFSVPRTDEYAQAMAAVLAEYWASKGRVEIIGQPRFILEDASNAL